MCGIAGIFSPQGLSPAGADTVHAMCQRILHRGPDDQGIFSNELGHIGMRRLAIIDLHSGHQPVHNEDRSVWIVFNGEIYNFKTLRAELEALGHRFYTRSDTECIVHAYEAWGEGCFQRLRGMFAVAILDLRQRRLVLGRDRLGKKPLYITQIPGGAFAFASELKCLFEVPGFSPRISSASTRDYFAMGYVPEPASIYENVQKVPPGHSLVIDESGQRMTRYWAPVFGPKWTADEATLTDQLMAHVDDAVRVRLVSDVPFGAFLSGGTDSSVVAALMARHMDQPVKTFSIGFREAAFNELPDARRVAQHIGAEHHELVVDADALSMIDDLIGYFDEPFGDSSAIPTYLVSRLAAGHVKMVLSGDGGDELFAGYERYRRYRRLLDLRDTSFGLAGPGLSAVSALIPGARGARLNRIGARLSQGYPDDYLSGVALATREDLGEVLAMDASELDPFASVRRFFTRSFGGEPLDHVLSGDLATYLAGDILVKVDRMTMANSLESRSPLLDHELLDFAARLPFDMKLRGSTGKYLFKQVAKRLFPADWLDKPKQGFAIPVAQWLRVELRERLQDTLASNSFRQRGLFNIRGLQRMLDEHLAGTRDHGEMLWLVLNYEAWARRDVDGRGFSRADIPAARAA